VSATVTSAFETARDFAEHGLPVLPIHTAVDGRCSCGKKACDSPSKHPRTANGLDDASTDERVLLAWNDKWADANYALACGTHVSVVDIDSKSGGDPSEVIPDYELADRPTVWTGEALEGDLVGERGAHVYCAPGVRTGKTAAVGVEIRGDRAYVLLPGSRHVSGVAYEWRNGARPWDVLQPVPEALVPRRAGKQAASAPRDPDDRVPHGERHNHLKDFGVRLVRAGVTDGRVILAHLWTHFRETCEQEPPPEPGRIEKLATWAAGSDIAERETRREHAKQDAKAALLEASTILGMRGGDPLIHAWRESEHQSTPLSARTESGITIRWERQRDMLMVDDLLYPVLAVTGVPGPEKPLTKQEAMKVYKYLVTAAETFGRIDMRDETYGWLDGFERIAIEIEGHLGEPASKFLTVLDMRNYRPDPDAEGQPVERWRAPPILTDLDTGDRYLGVQDLADHLRKDRRITVEYAVLTARMGEIGWTHHELQVWEPEVPRAEAQHPKVTTYRWQGGSR
jgi:hypothetical protein